MNILCSRNTSGFVGVHWDKRRTKWRAVVGFENRNQHIGYFLTERDAVIAYNNAARRLHGEKAKLNPVPEIKTDAKNRVPLA